MDIKLKNLFFIFSLLFSLTTFGQRMPILHIQNAQDSLINKYDSLGRKSGLWVKYFYDKGDHRRIINVGNYNAGKKIGTWKYFTNDNDLVCLDTANCLSLTEIYGEDGSLRILGIDETNINADSSIIIYTRINHSKVTCKKNKQGQYECIRLYNSKTIKPNRKIFTDFENCLNNIDTKW